MGVKKNGNHTIIIDDGISDLCSIKAISIKLMVKVFCFLCVV